MITRAWELFSGAASDQVNICAGDDAYGGANALQSRALAWLLTLRHRPVANRVRAAAIFDADASGKGARDVLQEEIKRLTLSALGLRVLSLRTPNSLVAICQRGFRIPIDLEALYTDETWSLAERRGWLEPRPDLGAILSADMVQDMATGGSNPFQALEPRDSLRLRFRFSDAGKRSAARRVARLSLADGKRELANFTNLTTIIRDHFGLGTQTQQSA